MMKASCRAFLRFQIIKREWPNVSKRPRLKRVALYPGRAGDKSAEHVASFNVRRDPQAKPAVLQYFGKTAVNKKEADDSRADLFGNRCDTLYFIAPFYYITLR